MAEEKSKAELRKEERAKSKEETAQLILKLHEQAIQDEAAKKRKTDIEEQEFIIHGRRITIQEYSKIISIKPQPHIPTFKNETGFYRQVYRLKGWPIKDADDYWKRRIRKELKRITLLLIYDRFAPEIYEMLDTLNPVDKKLFFRPYRLFQYLQEIERQRIEIFITEAVTLMKKHTIWDEFLREYRKANGLSYQRSLNEQ